LSEEENKISEAEDLLGLSKISCKAFNDNLRFYSTRAVSLSSLKKALKKSGVSSDFLGKDSKVLKYAKEHCVYEGEQDEEAQPGDAKEPSSDQVKRPRESAKKPKRSNLEEVKADVPAKSPAKKAKGEEVKDTSGYVSQPPKKEVQPVDVKDPISAQVKRRRKSAKKRKQANQEEAKANARTKSPSQPNENENLDDEEEEDKISTLKFLMLAWVLTNDDIESKVDVLYNITDLDSGETISTSEFDVSLNAILDHSLTLLPAFACEVFPELSGKIKELSIKYMRVRPGLSQYFRSLVMRDFTEINLAELLKSFKSRSTQVVACSRETRCYALKSFQRRSELDKQISQLKVVAPPQKKAKRNPKVTEEEVLDTLQDE
jgi:hypothetical protein